MNWIIAYEKVFYKMQMNPNRKTHFKVVYKQKAYISLIKIV